MIEKKLDRAITDFIWNVVEIHSQLEDIHSSWAELLGITEPQWLILMAITELDEGRGVAGTDIANKLRVHPAFVTNQTKNLEKNTLADLNALLATIAKNARLAARLLAIDVS